MTAPQIRAAIYARYSSDNQREESITAQLRAIHEYCKKHGYILSKEYIDRALSARTDDRPAFQLMIEEAQQGLFDVLVIHKVDRFARNRYDSAFYKQILKKSGVKIAYVDQQLDDSPESIILESVLEGFAEYYSANLAREIKKGQKENALLAKHNGGKPPLGYDVAPDMTYIVNENEALIIRRIFSQYIKGVSLGAICQGLNEDGFRTKRGSLFIKSGLHDLLKNDKYIGRFVFGKSTVGVDGKRKNRQTDPNAIIIENALPAIIDLVTWEKVQDQMKKNAKVSHTAKQVYLFSGLLFCSCGSAMVGTGTTKNNDKVYSYYRCGRKERIKDCDTPKFDKEKLETMIFDKIFPILFSPESAKNFIDQITAQMTLFAKETLLHVQSLHQEKKAAKSKIENLLRAIEEGHITPNITDRIEANENLITEIDKKLKKIEKSLKKNTLTENQLTQIYQSIQTTKELAALKLLAQTLIKSITIDHKNKRITLVLIINNNKFGVKLVTLEGFEPPTF